MIKEFKIMKADGQVSFLIEGTDFKDAAFNALESLGWQVLEEVEA
jgi:hypothetical protein